MATFNKNQGESLGVKYGLKIDGSEQVFDADWQCKLVVKLKSGGLDGATKAIDKTITTKNDSNTRFIATIDPSEMAGLAVADYYFLVEISSATLKINKEFQDKLTVAGQGIN